MPDYMKILAVDLPEDAFVDGDDVCVRAGMTLAENLAGYLRANGHTTPEWVGDGRAADAWVCLESQIAGEHYAFTITHLPRPGRDCTMSIQYAIKTSKLQGLMDTQAPLQDDDPIHELMKQFGATFAQYELLSASDLDDED